jgi:hypothetical protein
VRQLIEGGASQRQVAKLLNVNQATISRDVASASKSDANASVGKTGSTATKAHRAHVADHRFSSFPWTGPQLANERFWRGFRPVGLNRRNPYLTGISCIFNRRKTGWTS